MKAPIPKGFKHPYLAKYDGRIDPYEHVASNKMEIAIIGEPNSLKCKLLSGTLWEATLRWYMGLPRASINSYQDSSNTLLTKQS